MDNHENSLAPDNSATVAKRTKAVSGRATRFKLQNLLPWLPRGEGGLSICHGGPIQGHALTLHVASGLPRYGSC
jgi:hypothetical protein